MTSNVQGIEEELRIRYLQVVDAAKASLGLPILEWKSGLIHYKPFSGEEFQNPVCTRSCPVTSSTHQIFVSKICCQRGSNLYFWIALLPVAGWGVAVLVGVPHKDAVFKTNPMNLLNEGTLKGTFFGNYKPRSDIPSVV